MVMRLTRRAAGYPQRIATLGESDMASATCDVCGNSYDKAFQVTMQGKTGTFDSFECAIQALAPICAHCGCRVIGHGVEQSGQMFCCAHCATQSGVSGLRDRV
jgi:Rieske Fe-S protein